MERPRILYLGTVGGLRHIDANIAEVLDASHRVGALTLVDVIQPTKPDWSHLIPALPHIDVLHLNTLEARLATGVDDPVGAADVLHGQGVKTVVITGGSQGLTAIHGEEKIRMPAFVVEEVDSTGAGDALCAGLIHSLLTLREPLEATHSEFKAALLEGQAAGAACVTAPGATTAVTANNVKRLLLEQGAGILSATSSL
jgi:sugar/nucleoside kinase (ribokinase family)